MRVSYGGADQDAPDTESDAVSGAESGSAGSGLPRDASGCSELAAAGWLPLFEQWLGDAVGIEPEPNAMVLATVGPDGQPTARTVLCKGADAESITFFTNQGSRKAREIGVHNRVAVTFPWLASHRQVHFRGVAEPASAEVTDAYWATRPRGSQLGAWASEQSDPIDSREALLRQFSVREAQFDDAAAVPLPPNWGGFRVVVHEVEFWCGRPNRVHERVRLTLTDLTLADPTQADLTNADPAPAGATAGHGWRAEILQP